MQAARLFPGFFHGLRKFYAYYFVVVDDVKLG
jgi:hypothetical protein